MASITPRAVPIAVKARRKLYQVMNILGIHGGHDASACVIRDGKAVTHILRERLTRCRHDTGICRLTIQQALKAAGLPPGDIDACAVTASHGIPFMSHDRDYFNVPTGHGAKVNPPALWENPVSLAGFANHAERCVHSCFSQNVGMHTPFKARLAGREIPAVFVDHHAAHAAASFYSSGFDEAAVLTLDSGSKEESGFLFFGRGSRLFPLTPHFLETASLYNEVAARCGLNGAAGAGKLMGLSAYGKPISSVIPAKAGIRQPAFRLRCCAAAPDLEQDPAKSERRRRAAGLMSHMSHGHATLDPRFRGDDTGSYQEFIATIHAAAERQDYDLSALGDASRLPSPVAADLAASAQKIFSDTLFDAALAAQKGLRAAGLAAKNLCLGGGGALNCPANTRLAVCGDFENVFIPPHCDDGGLSLGAAWWYAHNVLNQPRTRQNADRSRYAMLGIDHSQEIASAIDEALSWLNVTETSDAPKQAAEDLAQNRVIGWFEGGSETGPRALGHRSILADPRDASNARRVNAIKERETWRPFAPSCLLSRLHEWFEGGPDASPFMLFTYDVKMEKRKKVPAITHVDGTARAQTVTPEDGCLHALLEGFEKRTGVPMVLNTSFNGPGEPIVETPRDALAFFRDHELDVLYLGRWRITRR